MICEGIDNSSSSAIRGTPQQITNKENTTVDTSPNIRMQNLEGHEETLQISEAIKNKNVTSEVLEEGGEMSQKNLEAEKLKWRSLKPSKVLGP